MIDGEAPQLRIQDREPFLVLARCQLAVDGSGVAAIHDRGRTEVPVGSLAALILEPGTTVSHDVVKHCARAGCRLIWVGEGAVKLYSAGLPLPERARSMRRQVELAYGEETRARVARRMFELRFEDAPPPDSTVEQLRGLEGLRVRAYYRLLSRNAGVHWHGRRYTPGALMDSDLPNRCLTLANMYLYAVVEAAVWTAGYHPAIGFIHSKSGTAFVLDIADMVKHEFSMPIAFKAAAAAKRRPALDKDIDELERHIRYASRDAFRRGKLLKRLIPLMHDCLDVTP